MLTLIVSLNFQQHLLFLLSAFLFKDLVFVICSWAWHIVILMPHAQWKGE